MRLKPFARKTGETGPLRVVIPVRGRHRDAAGAWLDFRGRATAYAGKPCIEVEHQFIHTGTEPEIRLASLVLEMIPQVTGQDLHGSSEPLEFQTGERAALGSSLAAARHWLDVDLCHFSPDPLQHGGLWAHAACHAPAAGTPGGVTPSHEWQEEGGA